jgi:hypothetical protein
MRMCCHHPHRRHLTAHSHPTQEIQKREVQINELESCTLTDAILQSKSKTVGIGEQYSLVNLSLGKSKAVS